MERVSILWCAWFSFSFNIPNKMPMAIVNSVHNLLKIASGFALGQSAFTNQVFKKLSSFHILQDQIPILGIRQNPN